jgi:hypothetical protein
MVARDSAAAADASAEAAKDSGEAGASNDSSAGTDAGAGNDATMKGEAGNAAADAGGGAASSSNGFVYHCSLNETTCPAGTAIAFGCAGAQSCSSSQVCCAEYGDGGFVAKCGPAPCASGKVLCISDIDCRSGEACVPASDYGGSYSTCVMADGGLSEGGAPAQSGGSGDGGRDSRAD